MVTFKSLHIPSEKGKTLCGKRGVKNILPKDWEKDPPNVLEMCRMCHASWWKKKEARVPSKTQFIKDYP